MGSENVHYVKYVWFTATGLKYEKSSAWSFKSKTVIVYGR